MSNSGQKNRAKSKRDSVLAADRDLSNLIIRLEMAEVN